MAEIPVHKKSSGSWWIWLLVAIIIVAIVWFLFGAFNNTSGTAAAPAVTTEPAPATASVAAPTTPPPAGSPDATAGGPDTSAAGNAGSSMASSAGDTTAAASTTGAESTAGAPITDASAYAAASDKLALAGRRANLDDVRVARIVGPKTFTIAAGSEEIYVMVGSGVNMAVGTQGRIDKGNVLDLQGSFQRMKPEEISDIANNRFRDLTPQEREFLRDRKVYLEATGISKVS